MDMKATVYADASTLFVSELSHLGLMSLRHRLHYVIEWLMRHGLISDFVCSQRIVVFQPHITTPNWSK